MSQTPEVLTAKPKVLSIHGVCPSNWQDTAKRVLEPHFGYTAIRYGDYDCERGGAIKAVVHPVFFLAAVSLFVWTIYTGSTDWWYGVAAGLVVAGGLISGAQRRRCGDRIKAQISEQSAVAYSTHVIAHSFGTYLTAHAMRSYDIAFDRVVLVGCVLPRRFDWNAVLSRYSPIDQEGERLWVETDIRNELGTSDLVSWLAGVTGWMSRELGRAGQKGFIAGSHAVHTTAGPWDACAPCQPVSTASIHNVPLKEYGHSKWALGPGHALHFWLPYLWGYPPARFKSWLIICGKATRELQTKNKEGFDDAAGLLLRKTWPWTQRPDGSERTLEECIREKIGETDTQTDILREVTRRLVHSVHLAQESAVADATADERIRWRLDPNLAIGYTISDVLDKPES